jgi:hypothetical protein
MLTLKLDGARQELQNLQVMQMKQADPGKLALLRKLELSARAEVKLRHRALAWAQKQGQVLAPEPPQEMTPARAQALETEKHSAFPNKYQTALGLVWFFGMPVVCMIVVSVYRRPLPSTNLGFLTTIMWDGREPSLASQSVDATRIHAQSNADPSTGQQQQIVNFESGIFTAQVLDNNAQNLKAAGANGGPDALANLLPGFYVGINDPLGGNPKKLPFTSQIFDLYQAFNSVSGGGPVNAARHGYTLLLVIFGAVTNATLYDKLNYNFIRDIAPVAGVGRVPNVLVVHPSVPAKPFPS